jgi:hypothetical protein
MHKHCTISIANIVGLVLSLFVIAAVIILCDLNNAVPLACKIFTSVVQIPCWGALSFIFSNELIAELRG